ncbi:hypothetical protein Unana1_06362 [Umbelopsis nana]
MAPGPTCTICHEQFVEEFEENSDPQSFFQAEAWDEGADDDGTDTQVSDMLQTILQSFASNARVTMQEPSPNINMSRPPESVGSNMPLERADSHRNEDSDSDSENESGDNRREGQETVRIMQLMNIIQQILSRAEGNNTEPLDFPMAGNLDDYVFTQNGLDDVITQLLEQATSRNAPPPASEEAIASLKSRKTAIKDIDNNQDCSVCKEDFVISEDVLTLPCEHFFHRECIKQWLLVNGTCPICRYSLADSGHNNTNTESSNETETETNEPTTDSSIPVQGTNNAGRMEGSWTSLIPGIFRWTPSSPFPRRTATIDRSNDQEDDDGDDNMDALD